MNQLDANLRLALKAQAQCRATLEALAAIKNPQPVFFVRQANIAHGPQQVNNGATADVSRAEQSKNQPNKLYGVSTWRTAGLWSGESAKRSRFNDGSHGSNQPDRRRKSVRGRCRAMPSKADRGLSSRNCGVCCASQLKDCGVRWVHRNLFLGENSRAVLSVTSSWRAHPVSG